ncbi:MAG: phage tail sheath family protein [Acidobacteria bacterium]|nr:phage tail sheath family protein [Acidobacteriota bacterium]
MEPNLTAPGVYLRRSDEAPRLPLESAVTAFVGIAERGPLHSPQPIRVWSDYEDIFGGGVAHGYLAESVFGFFRNGGEKCWVVRAADTSTATAVPPAASCPRVDPLRAAEAVVQDHLAADVLRVRALDAGSWGNRLQVRISTSTAAMIPVGVLTAPTTVAGAQIFVNPVSDLVPGGALRITNAGGVTGARDLQIQTGPAALNAATGEVRLTTQVDAVYPTGSLVFAPGFRLEAEFRGRREVFDRLSIVPAHPRFVELVVNGSVPLGDYIERRRLGISLLIEVQRITPAAPRFRPQNTAASSQLPLRGGGDGFIQARAAFRDASNNVLVTLYATRDRGSAGNGLRLRARPFATRTAVPIPTAFGAADVAIVEQIDGFQPAELVRFGDLAVAPTETASPSVVDPASSQLRFPANLAVQHPLGETVAVDGRFTLEVLREGDREPREILRNLSGNAAAGSRFVRTALAAQSSLLCADTPPALFSTPILSGPASEIVLAGGVDPGQMDHRYYTGYQANGSYFFPAELPPGTRVGLAATEDIDDVTLVAAPDLVRLSPADTAAAQVALLAHCQRAGDRFALLDSPADATLRSIEDWANATGSASQRRFGAAFHPWVQTTFEQTTRVIPPSGFIAGLFARTDRLFGTNKAPANELVKGAEALLPSIDRRMHGVLNPLGVNCIVKLTGGAIHLMGSRTLSVGTNDRHLNIRRTLLAVKRQLSQRMLWTVFEPADAALCRRIESTLTTFLQSLLAKGVTASTRPSEAFYVKCNEETNPPSQIRQGIVVTEIGLALNAPAEFIVLTARRTPDAVHLIEEEI